ncbi:MAG TPA: hypothetical protein QF564_09675 [Pirellulaceae bacterium]|nr:hypothetical protein [Pirellulaceae bacterium]
MNPPTFHQFGWSVRATCLLVLFALNASPTIAQTPPPQGLGFSNPPLRYEGPDPTANQFLPANSTIPYSIPSSTTFTPLPSPEFSAQRRSATPHLPTSSHLLTQTFTPQLLTPNTATGRFSLPESSFPGQAGLGLTATQPAIAMPDYYGTPISEGELVFPAVDPTLLHDSGITDHKDGFFQLLCFNGTWIDRNDKSDDFGVTEIDLQATFALPLPTREWPLLITPAFNTRFLDGPQVVNLPPQLYETYLDFTWLPRLSSRWTAIVGVAPSIFSDFEHSTDAFRVTGKGMIRYDWRPGQLQMILGILYLGREDATTLPVAGVIWTPDDRKKYEVVFPRPKLAHLIRREARHEDWLYFGAEFGGDSYAIERIPSTTEKITLRDYRAYVGLERKLNGGAGFRLEIGFVWGRVIEFASGLPDLKADDTAMIRGGITF